MPENTCILIDLDDVLVDFTKAACEIHGFTKVQMGDNRPLGQWSIIEPLGLTLDDFWEPISAAGSDFWANLEPLPWIDELLNLIQNATAEWYVVTAPSQCPTSYNGKVLWLKNYFGDRFDKFVITPHKFLLAKKGTIIIDDRYENCENFVSGGGCAITFPTRGNPQHALSHDPVAYVKQRLRFLTQEGN